ncbi:S-adenosyl-L-methionine-dependent methyltransferase [Polychytrium aggregatum]|uniref:S-adenosyl-L-methionine-dependent methyltransferase n=1 Tax=Polychytrium aggregatum TaxID=110093 RepID=UPI0022FF19BA|nr:S-adenosyl-L-methionine-dependent methyltransferase [Polychytrium aggregatum]KAI9202620.1 S-adenosyl-L-methionine-dependent methyltransferase [Polychytrium aggregatum]
MADRPGKPKSKKKEKEDLRRQTSRQAFLDYYRAQYGDERWSQLLLALEKPTRYCCLVNKYVDPEALAERLSPVLPRLRQIDFVSIPCLLIEDDENEAAPFPSPMKDMSNICSHYLLDAASVLVTEALEICESDRVLDMCAAPGGKSLCIVQRLSNQGALCSNEVSPDRRRRLRTVLQTYCPPDFMENNVRITGFDATKWAEYEPGLYDKVLIDAPCSTDRHILHDFEDLLKWTPARLRNDSHRQIELLLAALGAVKEGGVVVYATCSLANVENDEVVQKGLAKLQTIRAEIVRRTFPIGEPTTFGWIVLPDNSGRWGPLYFAILRRLADAA